MNGSAIQFRGNLRYSLISGFVDEVFGEDMHDKRVQSLACAALGAIQSCSLAVRFIGQGLAQAQSLKRKHCIKQMDRLFGNARLDVWRLFEDWVPYVVGNRDEIRVYMEWKEAPADGHATLLLSMAAPRGDITPLVWSTMTTDAPAEGRITHEDAVLGRLRETLPGRCRVTILADQPWASGLYKRLRQNQGFDTVLRIRGSVPVEDMLGELKPASGWMRADGRIRTLRLPKVGECREPAAMAVFFRPPRKPEDWCLVGSRAKWKGRQLADWYVQGRDTGSGMQEAGGYRFGQGIEDIRTRSCERRDRLYLVSALSIALLNLLGAAGETEGLDRNIKPNTVGRRVYSLLTQGSIYYGLLPGMKDVDACALVGKFNEMLAESAVLRKTLGIP